MLTYLYRVCSLPLLIFLDNKSEKDESLRGSRVIFSKLLFYLKSEAFPLTNRLQQCHSDPVCYSSNIKRSIDGEWRSESSPIKPSHSACSVRAPEHLCFHFDSPCRITKLYEKRPGKGIRSPETRDSSTVDEEVLELCAQISSVSC